MTLKESQLPGSAWLGSVLHRLRPVLGECAFELPVEHRRALDGPMMKALSNAELPDRNAMRQPAQWFMPSPS